MSFLSCEEMLAAARSQNLSLAEAILRSDLAESRLTEEASRHAMHHLWHVMEPPAGSMTLLSAAAAACPARCRQGGTGPSGGQELWRGLPCRGDRRSPQDR